MSVASSPAPQRPQRARRSIRVTFLAMVIVPVLCLVVFWGLAVGFTSSGGLIRRGLLSHGHPQLAEIAVQVGAGVIVVLVSAVLMGLFARQLRREVSSLEATARHLADVQLPQIMTSLREGKPADAGQDFEPSPTRIKEIAQVAAAITSLRHTAVAAAADEARLRNGIAQVFVSLARRNQSLLQRQLHLIDTLEQKAADPDELSDLFSLDHLTTRMRRHAENLIILSGASPGRSWSDPVPVIDVIRGAMAEVEDYQRVRVLTRSEDAVTGGAVADMIHLLAELIENATLFSPSGTRVEVRAERVANGFVIEVEDRGLGIQPDLLTELNQKLVKSADFDLADPDRLGLFVVAKLAAKHSIRVSLNPSPYGGTTAVMLIPHTVVVPVAEIRPRITAAGEPAVGDAPRDIALAGWSRETLALSGHKPALPAAAEPPPGQTWSAPATAGPATGSPTGSAPGTAGPAGADGSGHGLGPLPVRGADDPLAGLDPENLLPRGADDRLAGLAPDGLLPHRGTGTPPPSPGIGNPFTGPGDSDPLSGPSGFGPLPGPGAGGPLAGRTGENQMPGRGAAVPPPSPSVDAPPPSPSVDAPPPAPNVDDLLSGRVTDAPPPPGPSVHDLLSGRGADGRPPPGPSGDDLFSGRGTHARPPAGPSGDDLFYGRGAEGWPPPGPSGDDLFSGRSADTPLPSRDSGGPPAGPPGGPLAGRHTADPLSGGSGGPLSDRNGADPLPGGGTDTPLADRTADDLLSRRGTEDERLGPSGAGPQPAGSSAGPDAADPPSAGSPDSAAVDGAVADGAVADGAVADGAVADGGGKSQLPRRDQGDRQQPGRDSGGPLPDRGIADPLPRPGVTEPPASGSDSAPPTAPGKPAGAGSPQAGRVSSFLGRRQASRRDSPADTGKAPPSGGEGQDAAAAQAPVGGRISAFLSGRPASAPAAPPADSPPTGPAGAAPPAAGPGGLPGASGPGGPGGAFGPGPGAARGPAAPASSGVFGGPGGPAPDSPFGGGPPAGVPPAATYRGLPRRVRQASLSPHLRSTGSSDASLPPVVSGPALENRAPERARDVVASFRSGWQRELPDGPDAQPGPGEVVAGLPDGTTPPAPAPRSPGEQHASGGPPSEAQQRKGPPWKSAARPDPEQT